VGTDVLHTFYPLCKGFFFFFCLTFDSRSRPLAIKRDTTSSTRETPLTGDLAAILSHIDEREGGGERILLRPAPTYARLEAAHPQGPPSHPQSRQASASTRQASQAR